MPTKKLIPIDARELGILRGLILERYQAERGVQFKPNSYAPQYDDLCGHIRTTIRGQDHVDVSSNQLRRLFYDARESAQAEFNIIYLTAFARYITKDTSCDYRSWMDKVKADLGRTNNGTGAGHHSTEPAATSGIKNPVPEQVLEETPSVANGQGIIRIVEGRSPIEQAADPPLSNSGASAEDGPVNGAVGSRPATHAPLFHFLRPFLYAALIAGSLTFVFVLAFPKFSGYDPPERTELRTLMASFFGFSVFGHLAMGIVTGMLVRWLRQRATHTHIHRSLLVLAPVLFFATFGFRQLFVKDGWLIMGRAGTGLFGEPDMETLAHAGSFSLCILLLVIVLSTRPSGDMGTKLMRALLVALACGMVFFSTSLLSRHLVDSGMTSKAELILAPSVLTLDFPHPERLPLVGFMVFVQCFLTLVLVEGLYSSSDKGSSRSI